MLLAGVADLGREKCERELAYIVPEGSAVTDHWPAWHTDDGIWIDADRVRIEVAPSRLPETADVERIARLVRAAPDLRAALELICENPNHELLPTERSDAEAAIRMARGDAP